MSSGGVIRPECSDLSVELSGCILVEDIPDLIWTTWEAKLVYEDEDLGHRVTLAEARFGTVDFDRLESAAIPLEEAWSWRALTDRCAELIMPLGCWGFGG